MITNVELLLKTLNNNRDILDVLFQKRNRTINLYEISNDDNASRLAFLDERNIINISEDIVELDEKVLEFFEEFLGGNDEINIRDVGGELNNLQHNIDMYITADHFTNQQKLIKLIRRILKKLSYIVFENLKQISLHVNITYKTQGNFKNKIKQLEFYKTNLDKLLSIEQQIIYKLKVENSFFDNLYNIEIIQLKLNLVNTLRELRISLIQLQKDVTFYINRILDNISLWEHIIRLKELKDNYEIQDKTNIKELASTIEPIGLYQKASIIKTQLDFDNFEHNSFRLKVDKIIQNKKLSKPTKIVSGKIDDIYFDDEKLITTIINTQALNKEFLQTSYDLFTFLQQRKFSNTISFEDKVQLYCKMLLEYESDYIFTDTIKIVNNIEYLEVQPKENI